MPLPALPTQPSKLLPSLFEQVEEGQRLTVFHVGPALQDTVDFFSRYRCKLHFIDLFDELPITALEENDPSLQRQFVELLQFPRDTQFDICLFWDFFNFLNAEAVAAFIGSLRPYLNGSSRAHGFSVHNVKTPQSKHLYGISQLDKISLRNRPTALPGYAPHSQSRLKELLSCFRFERSVLLPDSRLEFLLRASL